MAVATTRHMSGTSGAGVKAPQEEKLVQQREDIREQSAEKAYALCEQRERCDGNALQDWLDAEGLPVSRTQRVGVLQPIPFAGIRAERNKGVRGLHRK